MRSLPTCFRPRAVSHDLHYSIQCHNSYFTLKSPFKCVSFELLIVVALNRIQDGKHTIIRVHERSSDADELHMQVSVHAYVVSQPHS